MQLLLTVLSNAAVLVPLVIGISLVFRISGVVIFAAGQIAVFAGMLYAVVDLPLFLRFPLVLLVGMVVSVLTYAAILAAQKGGVQADAISLATLGIAFLLEYVAIQVLGRGVFAADPWVAGSVTLLGTQVSIHRLVVIGAALVLAVAVMLIVDRTLIGRAMEATAFDPSLALLYGIRSQRFRLLAWAMAGICIATVGVFQVSLASISQSSSLTMLTLGLAAAVVGGLGGLYSGIAGAIVIAAVQAIAAQYISSELQVALVFTVLFVVLIFRPGGLFQNSREARRV